MAPITGRLPGVLLCASVSLVAVGLAAVERVVFGATWVEPLVLAILVGTAVRTAWAPPASLQSGIAFSAKMLLEIAVVLLGLTVSAQTVLAAGLPLLAGIAATVAAAIAFSYGLARAMRLPRRMSMLVACGNSICGNSAIAAVAPVIGASGEDVAASIAFTAVLGVAVVLGLPLLIPLLHLRPLEYGVMAGLTVYAVPQVLAAAAAGGTVAVQIGTLVKLVRVLMLGPLVLVLSVIAGRQSNARLRFSKLVPWFILGFLALVAVRSTGTVPDAVVGAVGWAAAVLTVVAMAALGLGTDLRVVARSGGRVSAVVVASLLLLLVLSYGLIRVVGV